MSLKLSILFSGLALLAPSLALPAAVTLNGTCEGGNCASPDVLTQGGFTNGSLNFDYTLANGDKFLVTGFYGGSFYPDPQATSGYNTSAFGRPMVKYVGNTSNASAASGADVLTFNFWQTFDASNLGTLNGFYSNYFITDTTGPIALSSTATGDTLLNGISVGPVTVGTGNSGTNGFSEACFDTVANCSSYGYPSAGLLTGNLTTDVSLSFAFGAGSGVGSEFDTLAPSPEPGSIFLLMLGSVAVFSFVIVRRTRVAAKAKL